jgi:simple sugar transport system ATP-binding protein
MRQAAVLTDVGVAVGANKAILSFHGISKSFDSVKANDDISFEVLSGGIHALVGENGAGKSTLTKILYGYYNQDAGAIRLNGIELKFAGPAQARRLGIGMVQQQLALVPGLTVFENIVLGDPALPFCFARKAQEKKVEQKAGALGFNFDMSAPVESLPPAQRQKLEIFKLLWREAKVLILDEPTSQLTPLEAEDVLNLIQKVANEGRIVIFITHHIPEILRYARRITVLRRGRCVASVDTASLTGGQIADMMVEAQEPKQFVGRQQAGDALSKKDRQVSDAPLVELQSISTKKTGDSRAIANVSLQIQAGEVVGVAGISCGGQNELGRLVAGLLKPASGTLSFAPQELGRTARELVCYIPNEQNVACAHGLSIAVNCFVKSINLPSSHCLGFVRAGLVERQARNLIEKFQISPPVPSVAAGALSGGNLQRMIIARELHSKAPVIVADNPCAGLDVAMARLVCEELRGAADKDKRAVLLISPDLDELMNVCDRILIMFNGEIVGEQISGAFDYQSLALMMGGKT